MKRWSAVLLFTGIATISASAAHAQAEKLTGPQAALAADNPAAGRVALPPLPPADTSTIFGGAISKVDPLRDQFMLNIYGQHPLKVLFDERTQLFRDGQRIPVDSLEPAEHASVQTALDGTHIFALRIHILSKSPTGSYRGRVLQYDPDTRLLKLDASPSPRPLEIVVPPSATFSRSGQTAFTSQTSGPSDLQPGALVSVTFAPEGQGQAAASNVVVLAVPGSSFIFIGNITALNTAAGTLSLVDPRDGQTYQLSFSPGETPNPPLHVGEKVRISARYNGGQYVASNIQPD